MREFATSRGFSSEAVARQHAVIIGSISKPADSCPPGQEPSLIGGVCYPVATPYPGASQPDNSNQSSQSQEGLNHPGSPNQLDGGQAFVGCAIMAALALAGGLLFISNPKNRR